MSTQLQLQFTDQDWERIERDWSAWWAGELERPLVVMEDADPAPQETVPNMRDLWYPASNFPLDMPADEVLDQYQVYLQAQRFAGRGDAWPKWWPNFGPGIVAGFLGAQVHSTPDTVWFDPLGQTRIQDLQVSYDPDNVWWRRVQELTHRAVERWGNRVCVAHTDLGGNLDILASLLTTQQLLVELHDHPDEVMRLTSEITHLWRRYYDELHAIIRQAGRGTTPWATLWSPGRCYMLQCDFSAMISPKMFERFVMPDLAACCEMLDHAFYHLDGPGAVRHLDMLLSLARLRGIQWIPGDGTPPPEEWLPLLKRIRDAGKLCQLYVSAQGARTIVHELGGRGFVFDINDRMARQEADDYINLISRHNC